MPAPIELRVTSGPLQGRVFGFDEHDVLLFGRGDDCHARLPDTDRTASRHHFLLEVLPPTVRVRDLGSLNGTFVNGRRHGGRAAGGDQQQVELKNGDEIQVGDTTLRVAILPETVPLDPADVVADPREATSPDYTVIRKLSEGGMGAVHLVERRSDGRRFARKVMLARVAVDPRARRIFEREIEITRALRHPNVVDLVDYTAAGSSFFFVMELCEGGSLADVLAERTRLPFDEAVPIMLGALDGLAHAHDSGIVHRDLKPGNILLTAREGGLAKIADLGLAKSFEKAGLSGITFSGSGFAGTLSFMPREQLVSYKYVRPATDVWSIAATFYSMLTGAMPREHAPSADPLAAVLDARAVPIRERNPEIPAAVAAEIDRALAYDAAARHQNARELRDALIAAV